MFRNINKGTMDGPMLHNLLITFVCGLCSLLFVVVVRIVGFEKFDYPSLFLCAWGFVLISGAFATWINQVRDQVTSLANTVWQVEDVKDGYGTFKSERQHYIRLSYIAGCHGSFGDELYISSDSPWLKDLVPGKQVRFFPKKKFYFGRFPGWDSLYDLSPVWKTLSYYKVYDYRWVCQAEYHPFGIAWLGPCSAPGNTVEEAHTRLSKLFGPIKLPPLQDFKEIKDPLIN